MNDSRTLRIKELNSLAESAQKRAEELKHFSAVINSHLCGACSERDARETRIWLLSIIDNRRALMLDKIVEYRKGIELARENARPEIGALFIDGEEVDISHGEEL